MNSALEFKLEDLCYPEGVPYERVLELVLYAIYQVQQDGVDGNPISIRVKLLEHNETPALFRKFIQHNLRAALGKGSPTIGVDIYRTPVSDVFSEYLAVFYWNRPS